MDTDKLLAFINVAETNSFSKGADQLFLNQPTISARIRVLEEELEVELFERSKGKGVKLSSYGKLFFPYAKKLVEEKIHCSIIFDYFYKYKISFKKTLFIDQIEPLKSLIKQGTGFWVLVNR